MSSQQTLEEVTNREYQYGFVTDIDAETVPPGLDESVVRWISNKKEEPQWLLDASESLPALVKNGRP